MFEFLKLNTASCVLRDDWYQAFCKYVRLVEHLAKLFCTEGKNSTTPHMYMYNARSELASYCNFDVSSFRLAPPAEKSNVCQAYMVRWHLLLCWNVCLICCIGCHENTYNQVIRLFVRMRPSSHLTPTLSVYLNLIHDTRGGNVKVKCTFSFVLYTENVGVTSDCSLMHSQWI